MRLWFQARGWFLWRALWRPKPRMLFILWATISTWDLLVAQFLPPGLAAKAPRVYDLLATMSGWLPWWAWALIGLGILLAVAIEFGVRQKVGFSRANLDEWRRVDPLYIWQAGCLWKGVKPEYPVTFDNPAYSTFSMLLRAAEHGELELIKPEPKNRLAFSQATRRALAEYANEKNDVPEFLRGGSAVKHQTTSAEPDITVCEAFQKIADPSDPIRLIRQIQQFRQKAFGGSIDVWGREAVHSVRKKLPRGYWQFYTVDPDSLSRESSHGATTKLAEIVSDISEPKMIRLETVWNQVNAVFEEHG